MRLYKFAAGSGNIPATYDIGRMYLFGYGVKKDYGTAAHWFRLAADRGDVYAQFNLGAMYANGDGLVADDVEAYKWLTIASRGGDKAADGVLDKLAEKMPPALISKAIKETDEWMANHPRGPTGFYLGK